MHNLYLITFKAEIISTITLCKYVLYIRVRGFAMDSLTAVKLDCRNRIRFTAKTVPFDSVN